MKYQKNEAVYVIFHGVLCEATIRDIKVKDNPPYIPGIVYTLDVMSVIHDKKDERILWKELVEGVEMEEYKIAPHPFKKGYDDVMTDIKKLAAMDSSDASKAKARISSGLKEAIQKAISNAGKYGFMEEEEICTLKDAFAKVAGKDNNVKAPEVIQGTTSDCTTGIEQMENAA